PAWRIYQTGVLSVGKRRHARRKRLVGSGWVETSRLAVFTGSSLLRWRWSIAAHLAARLRAQPLRLYPNVTRNIMAGAVASHGALDAEKQRPDNGLCVYG